MKDVSLPGPHTRMVMFAETVFKLKFKLRYIYKYIENSIQCIVRILVRC